MDKSKVIELIKEMYPKVDWLAFEDCDRSLNWELWNGPLPSNYWTYVEPLEHYVWKGFEQACKDIEEILSTIPHEMWFDLDGESCITDRHPENEDSYWNYTSVDGEHQLEYEYKNGKSRYISIEDGREYEPDLHQESIWVGGDWESFNPRQILMHEESWKQVF